MSDRDDAVGGTITAHQGDGALVNSAVCGAAHHGFGGRTRKTYAHSAKDNNDKIARDIRGSCPGASWLDQCAHAYANGCVSAGKIRAVSEALEIKNRGRVPPKRVAQRGGAIAASGLPTLGKLRRRGDRILANKPLGVIKSGRPSNIEAIVRERVVELVREGSEMRYRDVAHLATRLQNRVNQIRSLTAVVPAALELAKEPSRPWIRGVVEDAGKRAVCAQDVPRCALSRKATSRSTLRSLTLLSCSTGSAADSFSTATRPSWRFTGGEKKADRLLRAGPGGLP